MPHKVSPEFAQQLISRQWYDTPGKYDAFHDGTIAGGSNATKLAKWHYNNQETLEINETLSNRVRKVCKSLLGARVIC